MGASVSDGRTPILLSWSSGKDSAFALHVLRSDPTVEVRGLLTTVNAVHERVAMHAVRRRLLRAQAEAVGLPLVEVDLPFPCSNEDYEAAMRDALVPQKEAGIEAIAFGDLFLEDVRAYREERNEPVGLGSLFPLWGRDTAELAGKMLASGQRAYLTCVDPAQCPREFAGRAYDERLLDELPDSVDPCGERGEFHTFVWDGPAFDRPVPVQPGEVVERGGFVFADLHPAPSD
ncbi:MAG: ATP-binding protein [Planctomycetota bacterium]